MSGRKTGRASSASRRGAVASSPSVDPQQRLWEPYRALVLALLWDDLDAARVSRAMVRTGAALMWLILALTVGADGWWWGIPMLLATTATVLHAQRLPLAGVRGRFGAALRRLLPQPLAPRVHLLGVVDGVGSLVTGFATGWVGNVFQQDERTAVVAPAAVILAGIVFMAGSLNVAAHVSWELGGVGTAQAKIRPFIGLIMGAVVCVALLPSREAGAQRPLLTMLAGTAWLGTIAICAYGERRLTLTAALRRGRADALRRSVRAIDAKHLHYVKNFVRPVSDGIRELHDGDVADVDELVGYLKQRVEALWVTVVATEVLLKQDQALDFLGATEAMAVMVGDAPRYTGFSVASDLEPSQVAPRDRELILLTVTDLTSNAMKAGAQTFRVDVRAAEDPVNGGRIRLAATCDCDGTGELIPEGSSLASLRGLVRRSGGGMEASYDGPVHRYLIEWPTLTVPEARDGDGLLGGYSVGRWGGDDE